jgi:hypothetical protein
VESNFITQNYAMNGMRVQMSWRQKEEEGYEERG